MADRHLLAGNLKVADVEPTDIVDDGRCDRLAAAVAAQIQLQLPDVLKRANSQNGMQVILHIRPGGKLIRIQWPPAETEVRGE